MDLDDVYEEVRSDPAWNHLRQPGIILVPGRGNVTDPIAMLVGEAPGATENTKRQLFCGPSGRVLAQLMLIAGLQADWRGAMTGLIVPPGCAHSLPPNSFITNVVKYRPPGNRTPTPQETLNGANALRREWMAIGRPRLIVAVGGVARMALAGGVELRPGHWIPTPDSNTYIYAQYHPAWGLRQGKTGRETMERQWEEMGSWMHSNGIR